MQMCSVGIIHEVELKHYNIELSRHVDTMHQQHLKHCITCESNCDLWPLTSLIGRLFIQCSCTYLPEFEVHPMYHLGAFLQSIFADLPFDIVTSSVFSELFCIVYITFMLVSWHSHIQIMLEILFLFSWLSLLIFHLWHNQSDEHFTTYPHTNPPSLKFILLGV